MDLQVVKQQLCNTLAHMHKQTQTNQIDFHFVLSPGYLYENSTGDTRFAFTGLTPYTRYTVVVRAKAAGEVGPAAQDDVITPAEG